MFVFLKKKKNSIQPHKCEKTDNLIHLASQFALQKDGSLGDLKY